MTTNHITSLHIRSVPVLDQDEALAFYTSHLGFEARDDIDLGFMRWLTIGVPGQDTSLLLELVGGPQHDETTAGQVRELVTKGALGGLFLLSDDVHATFAALRDAGVEITQEPVQQPYGTDFGIRDPFGNPVRISQPNAASPQEVQDAYESAKA
jgi:catechol 2,3-dioxygenase-like lactoylglutathione lyase family enzyme